MKRSRTILFCYKERKGKEKRQRQKKDLEYSSISRRKLPIPKINLIEPLLNLSPRLWTRHETVLPNSGTQHTKLGTTLASNMTTSHTALDHGLAIVASTTTSSSGESDCLGKLAVRGCAEAMVSESFTAFASSAATMGACDVAWKKNMSS
jgi:hypothetical protein